MPNRLSKKNRLNKLYKGGDHKKILVLCQRKTGKSHDKEIYNVEDVIIPRISQLVNDLMGEDSTITYMSMLSSPETETVDIDCRLDGITQCSIDFILEHGNSFDLILLQTCPFLHMDFTILYNLLKPTGMIGLIIYPSDWESAVAGSKIMLTHRKKLVDFVVSKNFVRHEAIQRPDVILFTKNIQDAGKHYIKKNRKSKKKIHIKHLK
jgi:hypothetical protein